MCGVCVCVVCVVCGCVRVFVCGVCVCVWNCAVGAEGACKWVCFIFFKTQHRKLYTSRPRQHVTVQQITQLVSKGSNINRLSLTGVIKGHKIWKWWIWIQSKNVVKIISHYISSLGFRTKEKMFFGVLCDVGSRKHSRHILCIDTECLTLTFLKFSSGFPLPEERYLLISPNSFFLSVCPSVFIHHLLSTKYSGWSNFHHNSKDFTVLIYFNCSLQTTQIGYSEHMQHADNKRLMSKAQYAIVYIVMLRKNEILPQ